MFILWIHSLQIKKGKGSNMYIQLADLIQQLQQLQKHDDQRVKINIMPLRPDYRDIDVQLCIGEIALNGHDDVVLNATLSANDLTKIQDAIINDYDGVLNNKK